MKKANTIYLSVYELKDMLKWAEDNNSTYFRVRSESGALWNTTYLTDMPYGVEYRLPLNHIDEENI